MAAARSNTSSPRTRPDKSRRSRFLVMPSAFRHSAVMVNRVRRSGPPSINANGARFSRSSTRCRTLPPAATRTSQNVRQADRGRPERSPC
jgi:hypothetical protein